MTTIRSFLKIIDSFLNRYTSYKIVTYGLAIFLVAAEVLALTGVIGISALGLLLTTAVLVSACFVTNKFMSVVSKAPIHTDSWLISALILACIMPQATTAGRLLLVALTGALAMISKFVLVFRGSHIFNPVAIAAFIMSVTGLLPAIWWVATPALAPLTTMLALAVLRKQRRFELCIAFGLMAGCLLLATGVLRGFNPLDTVKGAIGSWPIIFMGSIMLTEPNTLPPTWRYQLLYALLVGALFSSQLHIGSLSTTPQAALIIGNLFTLVAAPARGMMMRLVRTTELAPNYYDMAFAPLKGRRLAFVPGQYVEWTLTSGHNDSRGNRRTFSIASAPSEEELHIGFKHFEPSSTFKTALLAMKPGDTIRASHIAGSFTLSKDESRPLVCIAGGIGITPFRSIIKDLINTKQKRDMTVLYLANSDTDFVYKDVLEAAKDVGVHVHYITGRLSAEILQDKVPDLARSTVYISGPDALVTAAGTLSRQLGVSPMRVKTDHFTGY